MGKKQNPEGKKRIFMIHVVNIKIIKTIKRVPVQNGDIGVS